MSRRTLQKFWEQHRDAEKPLRQWFKTSLDANWQNLTEVRLVYPHADAVDTSNSGTLTVFNICGNKYRLVARIRYDWQLINIRCVLTHRDYDRGKWKE
jgi:mRNA interferase HigB